LKKEKGRERESDEKREKGKGLERGRDK